MRSPSRCAFSRRLRVGDGCSARSCRRCCRGATRSIEAIPVRGNIETRLRKLIEGDAHGLVVAKAALDRLLGFGPPFEREAAAIRAHLRQCRWMVMPMREFPWAPAQGAIAIEIASSRPDLEIA